MIDRRLAREVEARAKSDLAQAPRLLADRNAAQAEALVMHAREVANAPGLAEALSRGDRAGAVRIAERARASFGDAAVIVTAAQAVWAGPSPGEHVFAEVQQGRTRTAIVQDQAALHLISLAPVRRGDVWLGAAGVSVSVDDAYAGTLAALTRSDVLLFDTLGTLVSSTLNDSIPELAARVAALKGDSTPQLITVDERQYLVEVVAATDAGSIAFVRDLTRDLAVLPAFRRVIILSGAAAVVLGMLLGVVLARRISEPVSALAGAADRLAAGDVDAPLMHSSIREIDRLSDAFSAMRQALALRISDVTGANRRLTDRQTRFESSQSEILQRERLAVSGRLVAELSHEIRNPIANLRNCLEIVRRRVEHDAQAREFTDLAIDELLRMHELAEQLLDLNRPRDPGVRVADVDVVIRELVVLASAGLGFNALAMTVESWAGSESLAAIAPDALKQVLLNLVQNAREALRDHERADGTSPRISVAARGEPGRVLILVENNGPGIPEEVLPRVFDPFFTTKGAVHGVGLGLFVAEGLVRTAGGRLTAANRAGGGVTFTVELLPAPQSSPSEIAGQHELSQRDMPLHRAPGSDDASR
ncbi:MAG: HAMP domain-containing protein [Phycisphaerae bacterium]|nr:HAMP domain-containing protein [Gemmatimonadaceae bacterium]